MYVRNIHTPVAVLAQISPSMLGIAQSLRRPSKRHKLCGSSFIWVASPDRENVDECSEWVLRGFIEIHAFVNYSQTPPATFELRLINKLKVNSSHRSLDSYKFPIAIDVLSSALLSQPLFIKLPAHVSQAPLPQECHQQVSISTAATMTDALGTGREMLGRRGLGWPVWKCKEWPDEVHSSSDSVIMIMTIVLVVLVIVLVVLGVLVILLDYYQ